MKSYLDLPLLFGYLDDILVYSSDMETHLEHLRKLFIKLREADLKLKEVKCNFMKESKKYGYVCTCCHTNDLPRYNFVIFVRQNYNLNIPAVANAVSK